MIENEKNIEKILDGTTENVLLNSYIRLTYKNDIDKLTVYVHIIRELPPMMKKIRSRDTAEILDEISSCIRQYMDEYTEIIIRQISL